MEFSSRIKLVVVGDGNVGKTCMLISYTTNSFPEEYVPTVFDEYSATIQFRGKTVVIALWDSAGGGEYDKLRPLAYPGTDVFLLCFSLVNRDSFDHVSTKWLPELREHGPATSKIVLVGCKHDLRASGSHQDDEVSHAEAEHLAVRESIPFIECSAITQHNLKNVFDTAMALVLFPSEGKKKGLFQWFSRK